MAGKELYNTSKRKYTPNTRRDGHIMVLQKKFKDFILELEWKACNGDNSGVFVRFPNPRNDPYVAVGHGYEI